VLQDPSLQGIKLIAEPWDLGEGGYQVGNFPVGWTEWTGKYRDAVRAFWKGEGGRIGELAYRLTGSSDLYGRESRRPYASINFVTAHDGFPLNDLVSYNDKHNEANGEGGNDGDVPMPPWALLLLGAGLLLGCGAAIPSLRAASAILAAEPGAVVACVAVEVCSAACVASKILASASASQSAAFVGIAAYATAWVSALNGQSPWLGLLLGAVFFFDSETPFPGFMALVPTVGTVLIILFAQPDRKSVV
jgi:hypothetical protein